MIIMYNTVKDIRQLFKKKYENKEFVIDKSGVKMLEIVNANFIADEETIIGTLNAYAHRELEWYKSQSLNVYDIPAPVPEIWKKVADSKGYINSNYGWCVYSNTNYNQFQSVLNELCNNPYSRRAIMIYTRPSMWVDYSYDGRSDFICTNTVQYLIRNNKLDVVVQMRSNDAHFGYKNDLYWQIYVASELLVWYNSETNNNIELGDIHWNAGSLHVYEKDFALVEKI